MIAKPSPYWEDYMSHKFKQAALCYKVGLCIRTGDVVWNVGPYPAGHWHDLTIFRCWLKWILDDGEQVEAELGYREEPCCKMPANSYLRYLFVGMYGRNAGVLNSQLHV